jgi:hypothetical protein
MPRCVPVTLFMTTQSPDVTAHLGSFKSIAAGKRAMTDVLAILRGPGSGWPEEGTGLRLYLKDQDYVTRAWQDW